MPDLVTIASPDLTVTVSPLGAELQSVTDDRGDDWLWDGDPRWWTGRAPILFPTVGVSSDGARFGGKTYPLGKHGFARGSTVRGRRDERRIASPSGWRQTRIRGKNIRSPSALTSPTASTARR